MKLLESVNVPPPCLPNITRRVGSPFLLYVKGRYKAALSEYIVVGVTGVVLEFTLVNPVLLQMHP